MRFEHTIDIAASPDIVWAVMSDLTKWPESVRKAARTDAGGRH